MRLSVQNKKGSVVSTIPKADIAGIECRFATHIPKNDYRKHDIHVVKEVVHTKDGRQVPSLRFIQDFKRDFYVTVKGKQNHEDKKELEELRYLTKFSSTQSDLVQNIAKALGRPGFNGSYKQIATSPYLYGSDILSTSVIKQRYKTMYPDVKPTAYSVAGFDTEKDMVHGTDEINMATISFGDRIYTAIQEFFVAGRADVVKQLHEKMELYLGEYVKKRNIKWEVEIVKSDVEVIKRCMDKAHQWKPDFITIWNIDFDMPLMLNSLKKKNVDPKWIFSDPSVPDDYKFFNYVPGPTMFVTASGKQKPLKAAERWNTAYCPASFYFIDGMCAYRLIRLADGEEQSYALDNILQKKLGIRKLKFKEADHMRGVEWHQFMQSEYPLEYVIYNVFDCVSMEELDEETKDLALQVPMMAGYADFAHFKSQPKRLVSELHYFLLENNKVMGSSAANLKTELDELTISNKGWITTLPAHLVADNGLRLIKEMPDLRTNIRGQVADLDVSASYPNAGSVFNVAKGTTRRELCSIEGVTEETRRMQGINLSGGRTNAVEVCVGLFNLPEMDQWLEAFEQEAA